MNLRSASRDMRQCGSLSGLSRLTQPIDIKRQTRRYTTWSGTHTYTPPCSMMSGRRMPLYMQRQLCRYTCSGIRAAMHEAAIVPLYRHAAATAATHKRSHSCKHSVFHQERLLDSSALDGRSCSSSRRLRPALETQLQKGDLAANGASYIIRLVLEQLRPSSALESSSLS